MCITEIYDSTTWPRHVIKYSNYLVGNGLMREKNPAWESVKRVINVVINIPKDALPKFAYKNFQIIFPTQPSSSKQSKIVRPKTHKVEKNGH